MKTTKNVHVLYVLLIISLVACRQNTELSPEVSHTEVDFSMKNEGCGDFWGFVRKADSVFLYQLTYDHIKFKSVDNSGDELVYEFPDAYYTSHKADVLPISNEELVISTMDDSYNVCVTRYNCLENLIDTICQTGVSDDVMFPGAKGGNMDNFYHQGSHSVFFNAVDMSVSEAERQALYARCVYQVNLVTGEHAFIDLKYPENYLSRIRISLTSDCYINECHKDLLIVFPMDEMVYKYNPADKSLETFAFEEFEHNPVLNSDSTTRNMEDAKKLYFQTFQYYDVFYDDSTQCYYRFYGDTATTENPNKKSVGFALYDDERNFIDKFSVNDLNLRNTHYNAIMTKKGLLYIEEIDKEEDVVKLGYLRVR